MAVVDAGILPEQSTEFVAEAVDRCHQLAFLGAVEYSTLRERPDETIVVSAGSVYQDVAKAPWRLTATWPETLETIWATAC